MRQQFHRSIGIHQLAGRLGYGQLELALGRLIAEAVMLLTDPLPTQGAQFELVNGDPIFLRTQVDVGPAISPFLLQLAIPGTVNPQLS